MTVEVVLFTRKHCGLCDEAATELRALSTEHGFRFVERDIDDSPELRERFDTLIPVVMIGGEVVAQAPFVPEELREIVTTALKENR